MLRIVSTTLKVTCKQNNLQSSHRFISSSSSPFVSLCAARLVLLTLPCPQSASHSLWGMFEHHTRLSRFDRTLLPHTKKNPPSEDPSATFFCVLTNTESTQRAGISKPLTSLSLPSQSPGVRTSSSSTAHIYCKWNKRLCPHHIPLHRPWHTLPLSVPCQG